jgi:hypothetical protein
MKIRGTTITTPIKREAVVDDAVVSKKPWSSKNTIDKLAPALSESGAIVACEPVEGYPLTVATAVGATTVTRCGKNLLDLSEEKVKAVNYINADGTQSSDFWGVEIILPPGTYTIKATETGTTATNYIYGQANDLSRTKHLGNLSAVAGKPVTRTATFTEWVRLYIYDSGVTIANGNRKELAVAKFNLYNIQLEVGNTATAFEPYNGETYMVLPTMDGPRASFPAWAGTNTIYADAGEVTVTGRADPTAIINKLTKAIVALGSNI